MCTTRFSPGDFHSTRTRRPLLTCIVRLNTADAHEKIRNSDHWRPVFNIKAISFPIFSLVICEYQSSVNTHTRPFIGYRLVPKTSTRESGRSELWVNGIPCVS